MAKTERLFDIIQILRAASKPVLAAQIAKTLEVSIRTIYRDIAYLQARQVPICGETGIGYVMRDGYDLPPLSFDQDEADAIFVGLSLVSRTGDKGLWRSARSAARKLREVAPGVRHLIASSWGSDTSNAENGALIRRAIRAERKLHLSYADAANTSTDRTVWPLAMIYYCDNEVLVSWCELRAAVRHFRIDRMVSCTLLDEHFQGLGAAKLSEWEENQKSLVVQTEQLV